MPTPTGWITTVPLCGENDPLERNDTANQYARGLWSNLLTEHNPDGTHQTVGMSHAIVGTYDSSTGDKVVTLTEGTFVIAGILILARGANLPVFANTSMPAGLILDLSIPGQFTVGQDDRVNAQGSTITYDYLVFGG